MIFADFETCPISGHIPPRPVGLALRGGGRAPHYYAFGHPEGNNCTETTAIEALRAVWGRKSLCFHNAKFDYGVAVHHWGLPPLNPLLIDDTMALASLDPTLAGKSLALKALTDSSAQDNLHLWIESHLGVKKEFGAHIHRCPGNVVEPYALADVDLTERLWLRYRSLSASPAYFRLKQIMPVVYRMEQRGVPLAVPLDGAIREAITGQGMARIEAESIAGGELSLNKPATMLKELMALGLIDHEKLDKTAKGNLSAAEDSLLKALKNPHLAQRIIEYRQWTKRLTGFLQPWEAKQHEGRLHASWRVVGATVTGRMSSAEPNMQQVPAELKHLLLPPTGRIWCSADYGQQELRILAHLSKDREMIAAFMEGRDIHQATADALRIDRRAAKAVNFGMVYGAGPRRLAEELGIPYHDARDLLDQYFNRYSGVKAWIDSITNDGNCGLSHYTLGGREVRAEEGFSHGEPVRLGYKLPNKIIQGSGADMMLDAIIALDKVGELLTVVHDEANLAITTLADVEKVREAMLSASTQLSVPMVVDVKTGSSWDVGK